MAAEDNDVLAAVERIEALALEGRGEDCLAVLRRSFPVEAGLTAPAS